MPSFLAVAEDNCRGPEQRARDQESEIRNEQGQQHENETADHRYPVPHPFSVGECDETEPAEDQAANAVCRKRIRHGLVYSLSRAKRAGAHNVEVDRIYGEMARCRPRFCEKPQS
jgi:hypothetical protein